jgi:hypothetical protein
LKLKGELTKKGLSLITILVIASVSAVAVSMSGLANDNKAVVTFELSGVGPNPPPGWPNYTHTWGGNFTLGSPLQKYTYTLDGKPVNRTVSNPPEINWSELPFPPLEQRDDYKRREFALVSITIRSANGTIIMTYNNRSSDSIDLWLEEVQPWKK